MVGNATYLNLWTLEISPYRSIASIDAFQLIKQEHRFLFIFNTNLYKFSLTSFTTLLLKYITFSLNIIMMVVANAYY